MHLSVRSSASGTESYCNKANALWVCVMHSSLFMILADNSTGDIAVHAKYLDSVLSQRHWLTQPSRLCSAMRSSAMLVVLPQQYQTDLPTYPKLSTKKKQDQPIQNYQENGLSPLRVQQPLS